MTVKFDTTQSISHMRGIEFGTNRITEQDQININTFRNQDKSFIGITLEKHFFQFIWHRIKQKFIHFNFRASCSY
jgi:hypothetical protein